jgi:hypothetical protein
MSLTRGGALQELSTQMDVMELTTPKVPGRRNGATDIQSLRGLLERFHLRVGERI